MRKRIHCPNCGAFLAEHDGDDEKLHKLKCRRCQKWIWYVPATDRYDIKDVPDRKTSAGKRFY